MNTYIQNSLRLLVGTLALCSITAQAESQFSLGGGVISTSSPYAGTDSETLFLPIITYEGERLSFKGLSLDYKLVEEQGFNWSLVLEPGDNFDTSDSDLAAIKALDDRKLSLYAGTQVSYTASFGKISASATHDVIGHGDGAKFKTNYSYPIKLSKQLMLIPSVGVELNSSDVSNYYYGVAQGESTTYAPYELSSTVNYNAGLFLMYYINKNWNVNAMVNYKQLDSDIEDSPIIDTDNTTTVMMSVNYRF